MKEIIQKFSLTLVITTLIFVLIISYIQLSENSGSVRMFESPDKKFIAQFEGVFRPESKFDTAKVALRVIDDKKKTIFIKSSIWGFDSLDYYDSFFDKTYWLDNTTLILNRFNGAKFSKCDDSFEFINDSDSDIVCIELYFNDLLYSFNIITRSKRIIPLDFPGVKSMGEKPYVGCVVYFNVDKKIEASKNIDLLGDLNRDVFIFRLVVENDNLIFTSISNLIK